MSEPGSEAAAEFVPPPLEAVSAWMDERLADEGIERTGEVGLPYVRPWAAVFSAPTSIGLVWLKAPAPGSAFEAGLYQVLLEVAPDHILTPIATNPGTGWLLLPDGGEPLAETAVGDDLVKAMTVALPQYAGLQRAMAARAEDLLGLGLADLRPQWLPDRFEEAVAAAANPHLTRLVPAFAAWCRELAASPVEASLDHNDLHPWNVLGLGPHNHHEGTAIFYDWGDSVVAHPYGSSLEPISRVRRLAGLGRDHPDVLRMRDAYLEVFDDVISRAESIALIEIAWRVAKAARAVVWDAAPEEVERYADQVVSGHLGL